MAQVVGVFATSHIMNAGVGGTDQGNRVFDGMREIGRRVQALAPDLIVIVGNDHMMNHNFKLQVPIVVAVSDEFTPFGDLGIPRTPFPGNRAFAERFVVFANRYGFDLAKTEEFDPDHGFALPLAFVNPKGAVPVVPIDININMQPLMEPARGWRLGETLRRFIDEEWPADQRVVVVGSGGLSHWLFVEDMGRINETFDRYCLDEITGGRAEALSKLTADEVVAKAGNGGIELVQWIVAAAALPDARGEVIYYEPIPQWGQGLAGIALAAAA